MSNFNRPYVTHVFASSGLLNLIKNVNDMAAFNQAVQQKRNRFHNELQWQFIYDTNNITNFFLTREYLI